MFDKRHRPGWASAVVGAGMRPAGNGDSFLQLGRNEGERGKGRRPVVGKSSYPSPFHCGEGL